jgi:hypothetical protein
VLGFSYKVELITGSKEDKFRYSNVSATSDSAGNHQ